MTLIEAKRKAAIEARQTGCTHVIIKRANGNFTVFPREDGTRNTCASLVKVFGGEVVDEINVLK